MKNKRPTSGFTLLELMLTIAVLMVLLVIAVPNYTGVTNSTRVKSIREEIQHFVNVSKSDAVFSNTDMYMHLIDLEGTTPCILASQSPSSMTCSATGARKIESEILEGITLEQSYPHDVIEISYRFGRPDLDSTTLDSDGMAELFSFYKEEDRPVNVKLSHMGYVTVCSDGGTWYGLDPC